MRYRTPEELNASLDRIEKRFRITDRITNIEAKILIPAVVAASILLLSAAKGSILRFLLYMAAFLISYLVIAFMIPLAVMLLSNKSLMKKACGGKLQSRTSSDFYKKYKGFLEKRKNDICSDELTAEAEKLAENESDPALRFILESVLMVIYGYRMENEKMQEVLEKCRKDYDPERNGQFEDLRLEVNFAILTGDEKKVLELNESNPDFAGHLLNYFPENVVDYALSASVCKRAEGDLSGALEYAKCAQKLHERARNILPAGAVPTRTERENYRRAAFSLETAWALYRTGCREKVMKELDNCDLIIADLKCEVPPLFIKEHQELIAEMAACSSGTSS